MRWLIFSVALGSFVIYAIAIEKLFSRERGVDPRMKALQAAGTISALVHLWSITTITAVKLAQALGALLIYATALAVFSAAKRAIAGYRLTLAFSSDVPQMLIRTGIYSRVRHPFYLAYSLTWIAGVTFAPSLWTVATTMAMICGYCFAARFEERKFLVSQLASNYEAYAAGTGLFFPRWRR